jgi:hypothetical protein
MNMRVKIYFIFCIILGFNTHTQSAGLDSALQPAALKPYRSFNSEKGNPSRKSGSSSDSSPILPTDLEQEAAALSLPRPQHYTPDSSPRLDESLEITPRGPSTPERLQAEILRKQHRDTFGSVTDDRSEQFERFQILQKQEKHQQLAQLLTMLAEDTQAHEKLAKKIAEAKQKIAILNRELGLESELEFDDSPGMSPSDSPALSFASSSASPSKLPSLRSSPGGPKISPIPSSPSQRGRQGLPPIEIPPPFNLFRQALNDPMRHKEKEKPREKPTSKPLTRAAQLLLEDRRIRESGRKNS